MTKGLHRYQQAGNFHFVTFSCYHRQPYLGRSSSRNLFESALETIRKRYEFVVIGYVVMPEHVHLLVNEPKHCMLDRAIQALKLSVTKRRPERPFWQARYYDFNVWNPEKTTEKLRYMHRNPVKRRLVALPGDWRWSSFRHYSTGLEGPVQIESFWTASKREGRILPPRSQNRDLGTQIHERSGGRATHSRLLTLNPLKNAGWKLLYILAS